MVRNKKQLTNRTAWFLALIVFLNSDIRAVDKPWYGSNPRDLAESYEEAAGAYGKVGKKKKQKIHQNIAEDLFKISGGRQQPAKDAASGNRVYSSDYFFRQKDFWKVGPFHALPATSADIHKTPIVVWVYRNYNKQISGLAVTGHAESEICKEASKIISFLVLDLASRKGSTLKAYFSAGYLSAIPDDDDYVFQDSKVIDNEILPAIRKLIPTGQLQVREVSWEKYASARKQIIRSIRERNSENKKQQALLYAWPQDLGPLFLPFVNPKSKTQIYSFNVNKTSEMEVFVSDDSYKRLFSRNYVLELISVFNAPKKALIAQDLFDALKRHGQKEANGNQQRANEKHAKLIAYCTPKAIKDAGLEDQVECSANRYRFKNTEVLVFDVRDFDKWQKLESPFQSLFNLALHNSANKDQITGRVNQFGWFLIRHWQATRRISENSHEFDRDKFVKNLESTDKIQELQGFRDFYSMASRILFSTDEKVKRDLKKLKLYTSVQPFLDSTLRGWPLAYADNELASKFDDFSIKHRKELFEELPLEPANNDFVSNYFMALTVQNQLIIDWCKKENDTFQTTNTAENQNKLNACIESAGKDVGKLDYSGMSLYGNSWKTRKLDKIPKFFQNLNVVYFTRFDKIDTSNYEVEPRFVVSSDFIMQIGDDLPRYFHVSDIEITGGSK